MPPFGRREKPVRKRPKAKPRGKKKDPIFIDGQRPRPLWIDYKDVELLTKLTNRQGKIVSRRKSGCTAASQHAITSAIKRARFMRLAVRGRVARQVMKCGMMNDQRDKRSRFFGGRSRMFKLRLSGMLSCRRGTSAWIDRGIHFACRPAETA